VERLGRLIVVEPVIKKDFRYFDQPSESTRTISGFISRPFSHVRSVVPQKYMRSYLNIKPETFSVETFGATEEG